MITFLLRAAQTLLAQAPGPPPDRRISDAFPDCPVTDQFGRRHRFRRNFVEPGGVLLINTIYTTCRGSCPGTSAKIESLRGDLSRLFGKRLRILSFTLEPLVDTPEKLLEFGAAYGAEQRESALCDWLFLAAPPRDWDRLRRSLGFFELDPRVDGDVSQHASVLLVGNLASDRWARFPSELRDSVLIDSIRRIGGGTPREKFGLAN